MPPLKSIRTAARAVIIHDGKLLATKMKDKTGGAYYILPGGGQQAGECLKDTVIRECLEEVGIKVKVQRLLYVREYIGKNHNFSKHHRGFHQLEHVFLCEIEKEDSTKVRIGSECDNHQVDVSWLSLENFQNIRFYPEALKPYFKADGLEFPDLYLGDCN